MIKLLFNQGKIFIWKHAAATVIFPLRNYPGKNCWCAAFPPNKKYEFINWEEILFSYLCSETHPEDERSHPSSSANYCLSVTYWTVNIHFKDLIGNSRLLLLAPILTQFAATTENKIPPAICAELKLICLFVPGTCELSWSVYLLASAVLLLLLCFCLSFCASRVS